MKKNFIWLVLAVLGVATFCLFNFPYLSTHSGHYSTSINGYAVLGKWADGALGGICALLQLLIWGVSLLITVFALVRLLTEILAKPVSDSFCGVSLKGLGELALLVHGIFSVLLLFFIYKSIYNCTQICSSCSVQACFVFVMLLLLLFLKILNNVL